MLSLFHCCINVDRGLWSVRSIVTSLDVRSFHGIARSLHSIDISYERIDRYVDGKIAPPLTQATLKLARVTKCLHF